ncbi:MAG TPA: hypothetical protein VFI47_22270 [Acidimicrobiales bacterium]|nr:hypothetical protein [Acidimicrobiales bacterium]
MGWRAVGGSALAAPPELTTDGGVAAVAAPPAAPPPAAAPLRTEFDFVLPRGYVDQDGVVHREGTMRLATARDELLPLYDGRVKERPEYLSVVLLARVVTRLGDVQVTDWVIEHLFASDLAFLQDLYRRINQEGHTRAALQCPDCQHEFTVDLSGGSGGGLGGS